MGMAMLSTCLSDASEIDLRERIAKDLMAVCPLRATIGLSFAAGSGGQDPRADAGQVLGGMSVRRELPPHLSRGLLGAYRQTVSRASSDARWQTQHPVDPFHWGRTDSQDCDADTERLPSP
jgi:hypothetical protein